MNKKYTYTVFIGRMQPPHLAHVEIIWKALQESEYVIILVGSANQPRTIKNPWIWREREEMIRACFDSEYQDRLIFFGVSDTSSNQEWARSVQDIISSVAPGSDTSELPSISLIGHKKDDSSYYLDMFPQWDYIEFDNIDDIHSTDIRTIMFENERVDDDTIPKGIRDYLNAFMNSEAFTKLKHEYDQNKRYRRGWNWNDTLDEFLKTNTLPEQTTVKEVIETLRSSYTVAPHEAQFITVDAVVVQSGHILMVRRRSAPGKGLWALPGGFLEPGELIEDGALRELREETKLKVPLPVLKGNIKEVKVFDDPGRSLRGRTVTHAHYIELPAGKLSPVKGGSDAEKAKWIPLGVFEKMQDQIFEDHYHIGTYFVGK